MLEQIPIEFKTYLLSIFNEIFSKSVFPHSWKSSLVVLIPKPGSKAIRFISLMRMQAHGAYPIPKTEVVWIESRPFCHNHNWASDLLDPVTTIWPLIISVRIGFLNQSPMAAVFLDKAGPFDNVDPHILLKDLDWHSRSF